MMTVLDIVHQEEAEITTWLHEKLSPICQADVSVLGQYVIALLKNDNPWNESEESCKNQLNVFLEENTDSFVTNLFKYLRMLASPQLEVPRSLHGGGGKRKTSTGERGSRSNGPSYDDENSKKRRIHDDRSRRSPDREDRYTNTNAHVDSRYPSYRDDSRDYNNRSATNSHRRPNERSGLGSMGGGGGSSGRGRLLSGPYGVNGMNMDGPLPGMMGGGPGMRRRKERCRDYEERGVCLLGDDCPYDHGDHPLIVDQMDPTVKGMVPPQHLGMPPQRMQAPVNGQTSPGEPYDPRNPRIYDGQGRNTRGGYARDSRGGPPMGWQAQGQHQSSNTNQPPYTHQYQPPNQHHAAHMPYMPTHPHPHSNSSHYQGGISNPHNASKTEYAPLTHPQMDKEDRRFRSSAMNMNERDDINDSKDISRGKLGRSGRGRGRGRGRGKSGELRGEYERRGSKDDGGPDKAMTKLLVLNLLPEQNTLETLNGYFKDFGTIVSIAAQHNGEPGMALIAFSDPVEAQKAYTSKDPVLSNPHVKLFFAPEESSNYPRRTHYHASRAGVRDSKEGTEGYEQKEKKPVKVLTEEQKLILEKYKARLAVEQAREAAAAEAKQKKEEDKQRRLKHMLDMQKAKQLLIEKQIQQKKLILAKLEDKTIKPAIRIELMASLKKLFELEKKQTTSTSVPIATAKRNSAESLKRAELDRQLDMMVSNSPKFESSLKAVDGKTSEKELESRLAAMQRQAEELGLLARKSTVETTKGSKINTTTNVDMTESTTERTYGSEKVDEDDDMDDQEENRARSWRK
eukprot:CFRG3591T1